MQTSSFQLGLIATLAVGLGFSVASSDAVGYPAGAAISKGENPVWSTGGRMVWAQNFYASEVERASIVTAPAGQSLIITDIHYYAITDQVRCRHSVRVDMEVGGEVVGSALTHTPVWGDGGDNRPDGQPAATSISLDSGIRVGPGETLSLAAGRFHYVGKWCGDSSDTARSLMYTLSGYYAQP